MANYRWITLLSILTVWGCAWLVPDREKEYLSVQPLPPLKLPDDLTQSETPSLTKVSPPSAVPVQQPESPAPSSSGIPARYLEVSQPFPRAWVSAIKALNRLHLEISRREPDKGILHFIHSTAEKELAEDRGWWGDVLYFFGGGERLREHPYQLLLQPDNERTRIYLLDAKGRPADNPEDLELFERLRQTLTIQPAS